MRIIKKHIILIIAFLIHFDHLSIAQSNDDQVRRWFVILVDQSAPFEAQSATNEKLFQVLYQLFENTVPQGRTANTILLEQEHDEGTLFFDEQSDEVSLFYFGIRKEDVNNISVNRNLTRKEQYDVFAKSLLRKPLKNWSGFKQENADFREYFEYFRSFRQTDKYRWNDGYSLSNYAYPSVLNYIGGKYYNELVVVLISDFRAGSTFGNNHDEAVLRESIFNLYPDAVTKIIESNNLLAGSFYKVDYFNYSRATGEFEKNTRTPIIHGLQAYKIKPHSSSMGSDNATLRIDGEIKLNQTDFESSEYDLKPIRLHFSHNSNLKVDKINLSIHGMGPNPIFETVVTIHDPAINKLIYENRKEVLLEEKNYYTIPEMPLSLKGIKNSGDLDQESSKLVLDFYTSYQTEAGAIPQLYQVQRSLTEDNFYFESDFVDKLLRYGVPLLLFVCIILWILYLGRPKSLMVQIHRFSDSFEHIDFTKHGRLKTSYRSVREDEEEVKISLELALDYRSKWLGWRVPIQIRLHHVEIPDYLDIHLYLKELDGNIQYIPYGETMITEKRRHCSLEVVIKKNDPKMIFASPIYCLFDLQIWIDFRKIWKTNLSRRFVERFHLGPDLGDNWMGLDPGTTGSCVAAGSHTSNVTIHQEKNGIDLITPSLIGFDRTQDLISTDWKELNSPILRTGRDAQVFEDRLDRFYFQRSIKKMLGYKDKLPIQFKNDEKLSISGIEMTSLMVRNLIRDYKESLKKDESTHADLLDDSGDFLAKKAVVAIPNNFTATKTQAMIDSLEHLGHFKEIRTISESEAVMIYYIFKRPEVMKDKQPFESERVLIFDMGGATVNTTLVDGYSRQKEQRMTYHLNVEAKLGYGIGGDTIDYCLLEYFYKHMKRKTKLSGKDIKFKKLSPGQKTAMAKWVFSIKSDLVKNYHRKSRPDFLISPANLITSLEDLYSILNGREVEIEVGEDDDLMKDISKDDNNYRIFQDPSFNIVYKSVETAVQDVFNEINPNVDTLIFSGRSTLFPGIRESVITTLKDLGVEAEEANLSQNKLKSAVALGACLYGVNNNAIEIDSNQVNSHFGVMHTRQAGYNGFLTIVEQGERFDGEKMIRSEVNLASTFDLDGKQARFLQVMGLDPEAVLRNDEKHKYSTLAKIPIRTMTEQLQMDISEDDEVKCRVIEAGGQMQEQHALLTDEEIRNANDEHYTWML